MTYEINSLVKRIEQVEQNHKELESQIEQVKRQGADQNKEIAVLQVLLKNIDKRTESMEDTLKWLVRLVIGALILAILGFALNGGLSGVTG